MNCVIVKNLSRLGREYIQLSQKELQAQRLRDCVNVRLEESTNRMVEVKNILASLYSDKALGNINQIQFSVVFEQITSEYESLCIQITEDTQYLEKLSIDSSSIDMFIKELSKVRKKLDTPDWDTFDKVIEKITVENKRIEQGREVQYINIYYRYIGLIEPLNVLEKI